jgi:hypothetical protein
LEQIINASDGRHMSQVAHPDRDCIYDEAEFCVPIPKYSDLPLMAQADHYRKQGHPPNDGLWATGLIVRNDPLVDFGHAWITEQVRWGFQDQISEAPLTRPHTLPFPLHGSGVFEWRAGHH